MIDAFASVKYELSKIKENVVLEVAQLKEECEDHLQAINENTEELADVQVSIHHIEEKIEKLNSRIDTIHMMFNQLLWQTKITIDLDTNEQILFQLLCSHKDFIPGSFAAEKTHLTEETLRETVTALMDKGVPVLMRTIDNCLFFRLEPQFRTLQRKNKIIKVNPAVCRRFDNMPLEMFVKKEKE